MGATQRQPSGQPRLVYLQWDHRGLPAFVQMHMQTHVKCLRQFFDLTVITGDCDYGQICDEHMPDAVLFESGVNYREARHPTIRHTSAHPSVPKLGLHNGDPWCDARPGFLSDMEQWGIDTFFTISTTMAEHTPTVADHLFVWPNFIDPELYHDYAEPKRIPVLITGQVSPLYPWRQRVHAAVATHFPNLRCPHRGYSSSHAARMLFGEEYARTISASHFVPSCGAVARELLRKHLEVPACKSCLVTERSPILEACGFVDMVNCVFADSHDVVDKLDHLLGHPAELERITRAGYDLVHARHTLRQRDQILQWVREQRLLQPGERLVQDGPLGPIHRVCQSSPARSVHIRSDGMHLKDMRTGDALLAAGDFRTAAEHFRRAACCIPWMPEPALKLALCDLHLGVANRAAESLERLNVTTLSKYGAAAPDPVEWAYAAIATLCRGDLTEAAERTACFRSLGHPELDRTRTAIDALLGRLVSAEAESVHASGPTAPQRCSVHSLPRRSFDEWIAMLCGMLTANGQVSYATTLRGAVSRLVPHATGDRTTRPPDYPAHDTAPGTAEGWRGRRSWRTRARGALVERAPVLTRLLRRAVKLTVPHLNRLELRYGYFLPYDYSAVKQDAFIVALRELLTEHDVRTAAVVGATAGAPATEAALRASRQGATPRRWHFINAPSPGFRQLASRYAGADFARFHALDDPPRPGGGDRSDAARGGALPCIAEERLDLLLMVACDVLTDADVALAIRSRLVALQHLRHPAVFAAYRAMLASPDHVLVAVEPVRHGGYAVFAEHRLRMASARQPASLPA